VGKGEKKKLADVSERAGVSGAQATLGEKAENVRQGAINASGGVEVVGGAKQLPGEFDGIGKRLVTVPVMETQRGMLFEPGHAAAAAIGIGVQATVFFFWERHKHLKVEKSK
jgi:hypothetical protein